MFQARFALALLALCATTPALAQRQAPDAWDRADSATVRLPPSAFPTLPAPIRAALSNRGCLIPQSPEVPRLHNVAQGHLRGVDGADWIALCSIARVSRILVVWAGDTTRIDSLPGGADRDWLQGMGGGTIAFSHVIGIADSTYIRRHAAMYSGPLPPGRLHDGINDAFAGKASTVLYWSAGRWMELAGAD